MIEFSRKPRLEWPRSHLRAAWLSAASFLVMALCCCPVYAQSAGSLSGGHDRVSDPSSSSRTLTERGPVSRKATSRPSTSGLPCGQDPECPCYQDISQIRTLGLTLAAAIVYWLAMVMVRWNRIARPTQELLRAEVSALQTEIALLGSSPGLTKISDFLKSATELIDEESLRRSVRIADMMFWSRGKELVGWGYVHEAEVQRAAFLAPEMVRVRLEAAERDLRASDDVTAISLANDIHGTPFENTTLPRQRALLSQALSVNYEREDNSFADLVAWQNKTSWLVFVGLLIIVILAGIEPQHAVLFVVGAVGGLLSRLSRSLERKDVPTDYGASWTTLFLSPVAGALGAWAGILLTGLAAKFGVLSTDTFSELWACSFKDTTLAVALVFGFSERLLDTVLDKLISKTGGASGSGAAQKPTPSHPDNQPPSGAVNVVQYLPEGVPNEPYSTTLSAPGVAAGTPWSAEQADLPAGLKLDKDGTLSGTLSSAVDRPAYEFVAKAGSGTSERAFRFRLPLAGGAAGGSGNA